MKNSFFLAAALVLATFAQAQTGTPPTDSSKVLTDTVASATMMDTSVRNAYVPHPERLKGLTTETLTAAHIFPALGMYKGNGNSTADVTVTLDSVNKGIVWIDGLPQGKFKAMLRKAPSTYKIPAQKSEAGKAIAEGTLYANPETNEITIVLGRPFNAADPASSLTVTTKKSSAWTYTGVKADAVAPTAPLQQ